jgi:hypothetical protein
MAELIDLAAARRARFPFGVTRTAGVLHLLWAGRWTYCGLSLYQPGDRAPLPATPPDEVPTDPEEGS